MRRLLLALLLTTLLGCSSRADYIPPRGAWAHRAPAEVGMDAAKLEEAVAYARTHETRWARDFSDQVPTFGAQLGPLPAEHGPTNGLVVRHGYIVAEWGDTTRVEPTYSAAKSFLSTLLGLAVDRRLVADVSDPVGRYVHDGGYDSPHNAAITWDMHAHQTSEWEGILWDKNADFVGAVPFGAGRHNARPIQPPGSFWEYNDVRINRFSLSLMEIFQRPLPDVLKREVMDPIGASDWWRWYGYWNSDAVVDGLRMKSVSGGTRWGGGLWISAQDQARFGLLFLRRGRWGARQIVSEKWVNYATTSGKLGPDYGALWWLNTRGQQWPGVPKSSFAAVGAGNNTIWIDPDDDIVVVWRWHDGNGAELFRRVVAAVR